MRMKQTSAGQPQSKRHGGAATTPDPAVQRGLDFGPAPTETWARSVGDSVVVSPACRKCLRTGSVFEVCSAPSCKDYNGGRRRHVAQCGCGKPGVSAPGRHVDGREEQQRLHDAELRLKAKHYQEAFLRACRTMIGAGLKISEIQETWPRGVIFPALRDFNVAVSARAVIAKVLGASDQVPIRAVGARGKENHEETGRRQVGRGATPRVPAGRPS